MERSGVGRRGQGLPRRRRLDFDEGHDGWIHVPEEQIGKPEFHQPIDGRTQPHIPPSQGAGDQQLPAFIPDGAGPGVDFARVSISVVQFCGRAFISPPGGFVAFGRTCHRQGFVRSLGVELLAPYYKGRLIAPDPARPTNSTLGQATALQHPFEAAFAG